MIHTFNPAVIINGHVIVASFDWPPIADRSLDWSAVTTDYEPGHPIGHGRTKEAAIADLLEQLDERKP